MTTSYDAKTFSPHPATHRLGFWQRSVHKTLISNPPLEASPREQRKRPKQGEPTSSSPPSPSNCPPKPAISPQSHSRTVHWCLRGPPVQSGSRGCEGATGWWNRPGERSPLRSGSPRRRAARSQSQACLRGWQTGRLPGATLLQKARGQKYWRAVTLVVTGCLKYFLHLQNFTQQAHLCLYQHLQSSYQRLL